MKDEHLHRPDPALTAGDEHLQWSEGSPTSPVDSNDVDLAVEEFLRELARIAIRIAQEGDGK